MPKTISKISLCGSQNNACDHLQIAHVSDQVTVLVDHTRKVVGHTRLGLLISLRTKELLWFKNDSLWYSILLVIASTAVTLLSGVEISIFASFCLFTHGLFLISTTQWNTDFLSPKFIEPLNNSS